MSDGCSRAQQRTSRKGGGGVASIVGCPWQLHLHYFVPYFPGTLQAHEAIMYLESVTRDRYGEFTVVPAAMANMQDTIIKRVPFGSVRDV